jgi:hypothetical protein
MSDATVSDSATHWQAAAKAVNSATLLDIDPRQPYLPKTTRPDGSMAHTPKIADVAVPADPLLREASLNHTLTGASQFPKYASIALVAQGVLAHTFHATE